MGFADGFQETAYPVIRFLHEVPGSGNGARLFNFNRRKKYEFNCGFCCRASGWSGSY